MPVIAEALSTISGAITTAKGLLSIASIAANAEAKMAIADLQLQLAEFYTKAAELIGENHDLKEEIRRLTSSEMDVDLRGCRLGFCFRDQCGDHRR
jgi:hypothetical protein